MATRVSERTKREIAERISILDVISPVVSLAKTGKYYKGLCPFHPDKNPSFIVNADRNTFYCFGCGTGGDAYAFFMKFHHVPFPQALEELARRAGVQIEPQRPKLSAKQDEAYQIGISLNRSACQFFQETFQKSREAEPARRYLRERRVEPAMASLYLLGYAPKEWEGLVRCLQRNRDPVPMACKLGLVVERKPGQGYYDRFRNRLMFPILDTTGQVLGFGGRSLDEQGPKYMNSPESFLYHKGSLLYGLLNAQKSIREHDLAILVEGYFDLIALHQNGFPNSVAVLGTSLTTAQIDLLKRYTRNVVVVFDGDVAGRRASYRNLPEFLERNIQARVVYLPEGEDPDSYLRKEGNKAFQDLLDGASALLDVFLRERIGEIRKASRIERKVSLLKELLPLLQRIPDRLEQNLRIQYLSEEAGVAEPLLREELSKQRREKREARETPPGSNLEPEADWPAEERLVCQILIQFPSMISRFMEARVLDRFKAPAAQRVVLDLSDQYNLKGSLDLSELLNLQDEPETGKMLSWLSCKDEFTLQEALTALDDAVRRILKRDLQERLAALNLQIREAEKEDQPDLQHRLFLEKQRLIREEKALFS